LHVYLSIKRIYNIDIEVNHYQYYGVFKMARTYCADRGDGFYVNPIFYGNLCDPSVLKEGDCYYITFGGPGYYAMPVFKSYDLVNWQFLYYALKDEYIYIMSPELVKFGDKYYIYTSTGTSTVVMTCDDIESGDWTSPEIVYDANGEDLVGINPGHIVDEHGQRYLFLSGNLTYPLSEDGMQAVGEPFRACPEWPIPDEWDVKTVFIDNPKLIYRNGYYYMVVAQGGTFGPPTAHMSVLWRSKSIAGPWEASPYNPVVHTYSRDEKWWAKGRGIVVEGPKGQWYFLYHAIMNGFRHHGRMTLMEPVEWTDDGWFKIPDGISADKPIPMPAGRKLGHGFELGQDFASTCRLSPQFNCSQYSVMDRINLSCSSTGLQMEAEGSCLDNSFALMAFAGHKAYMVETKVTVEPDVGAGLTIQLDNDRSYGIALMYGNVLIYMEDEKWVREPEHIRRVGGDSCYMRLKDDFGTLSAYYSLDGCQWHKINICADATGWNHNTCKSVYGWARPGLFAIGNGKATFDYYKYTPLCNDV